MSEGILYKISAIDDFSKTFDDLDRKMGNLTKIAGGAKAAGAGLTAFGGGMALGLAEAVSVGADFDKQLSGLQAISGATTNEFSALREQALTLGATTSKSASEAASGMTELAKAGFNVNDIMSAMPGVISASEASGADMAQVAEVMGSALNGFGLDASKASNVADILAMAANQSATDITGLQYALKYAAPNAQQLGISLEEVAAATGLMADAGISGETAGTSLRMAFARLAAPTSEAAALMDELGFSAVDSEGNFKSLGTIIEEISSATDGMSGAQRVATMSTLFGTEAASGMMAVMAAGPQQFNDFTSALENSSGASAEAAAIMRNNLAGSLEEMKGALETLAINISDVLTPAIEWLVEKGTGIINWFNNLSPEAKTIATVIAAAATAFGLLGGPLLLLIGFLPQIVAGFGLVSGVLSGVALGPIALVVGAIGGLIAIFATLWATNEDFRNGVIGIWNKIKETLGPLLSGLKDAAVNAFGGILKKAQEVWPLIKSAFLDHWNAIWENLKPALDVLVKFWGEVFEGIGEVIKIVFNGIKEQFGNFEKILSGIMDFLTGVFTGNWDRAWSGIKSIVEGIWKGIETTIKTSVNAVIGLINAFIDGFNSIKISVPSVDIPLVGKVGGFTIGMPQIPRIPALAIGTDMVKESGLATIHKGESVVPAKVNRGGYSGGSGASIVINATYVDPTAAERFATEVNRILGRRTGGKW